VGVFSLKMKEKLLKKLLIILVAFSAGALLSGAFLHLMEESLDKIAASTAFAFLLAGFVIFFLVERFLHWHHCHDGKCDVHPFSYLILFGDAVHNFIDGVVIAASFLVSVPFGFVTAALIIAHELPQELGNFGVLVYGGFSKGKAIVYSFIAQLTSVVGGVVGYFLASSVEGILPYILPAAAGGFVYIAASDLIPELHKEPRLKKSMVSFGLFVLGILFVWAIKFFFEH
ncbi:MAG: ZIP family metal transporter, partial [Candidatus Woesearchaeota archaeon]